MVPDRIILSPTFRFESSIHREGKSLLHCFTTRKLFSNAAVLLPIPDTFITQPPKAPFSTTFVSPVTMPTFASMHACLMLAKILSKSVRSEEHTSELQS